MQATHHHTQGPISFNLPLIVAVMQTYYVALRAGAVAKGAPRPPLDAKNVSNTDKLPLAQPTCSYQATL